jgi:Lsr2
MLLFSVSTPHQRAVRGMVMQRIELLLEDDLTGGPADETVPFALDGKDYEVDLSARHAADFRRQLAPFVNHARPTRSRQPRRRTTASRERSREIRSWAEQRGLGVAEHGRLPRTVIDEYEAAHSAERRQARSSGRRSASRRATGKSTGPARRATRKRSGR